MADDLSQIHPDTIRAFEPGLAERTQSWNTVSSLSSTDHPSPSNVSPRPVNLLEKKGQKLLSEASEIQLWWDQEMCKELKLPPGYRKVGVLLIKWSSEIDEFKQRGEQEVRVLQELFEKRFNYKTFSLSLTANHRRSPEVYLQDRIRKLMKQHDSVHDLLIVYYSGHGSFYDDVDPEKQFLELHATRGCDSPACLHPAKLNWNKVEEILIQEGKGDILVIMDACFAGNLNVSAKSDLGRAYEVLGACKKGRTTAAPGPKSFTHHLHKSLEDLICRYPAFTTADLLSAILEREDRRSNPPDLWSRSTNTDRHIRLAPVSDSSPPVHANYFDDKPIAQYLTLRVELKDFHRPSQLQIEELARNVSKAVRDSSIRTRRIDCLGLTPKTFRSLRTAAQMISSVVRFMGFNKTPQNPLLTSDEAFEPRKQGRKRSRMEDSDLEDQPTAKRRASGASLHVCDSPRPLTPISAPEG